MQEVIYPVSIRSFETWLLKTLHTLSRQESLEKSALMVKQIGEITLYSNFATFPEEVLVVKSKDDHLRISILPKFLIKRLFNEESPIIPIVFSNSLKFIDSKGDALVTDLYFPKRVRQNLQEVEYDSCEDPDYILISVRMTNSNYDGLDNNVYFEAVHLKDSNTVFYRAFSQYRTVTIEDDELCFKAVNSPAVYVKKLNEIDYEVRSEMSTGLVVKGALAKIRLEDRPFPHFVFSFNSCMVMDEEFEDVEIESMLLYASQNPIDREEVFNMLPGIVEDLKERKSMQEEYEELTEGDLEEDSYENDDDF